VFVLQDWKRSPLVVNTRPQTGGKAVAGGGRPSVASGRGLVHGGTQMVKGVRGRAANLLECGGLVSCLEQYADDLAVRGYRLHEQQDHTPDIYRASTLLWQPPCDDVTSSSRPTTEDGVENTGLCTPRVFFYQANV